MECRTEGPEEDMNNRQVPKEYGMGICASEADLPVNQRTDVHTKKKTIEDRRIKAWQSKCEMI